MFNFWNRGQNTADEFARFEPAAMPSGNISGLSEFSNFNDVAKIREALSSSSTQLVLVNGEAPSYENYLKELAQKVRFPFEWHPDQGAIEELLPKFLHDRFGVQQCIEIDNWVSDIKELGDSFVLATGAPKIAIRVHAMDPVRKSDQLPFHTDSDGHLRDLPNVLPYKLLRVEVGDSLEWVGEDNLKENARMYAAQGGATPEQILLRPNEIFRAPSQANVFIKLGDEGLIHRTPRSQLRRIRVQIDSSC